MKQKNKINKWTKEASFVSQEDNLTYEIGQHLKELRKKSKLTQSNIGAQCNVTFQQVQKWEKGINRIFAVQLVHLCKENNWNINEFMALESSIEAHNS